jgi:putative aldouronate transport system permease protein
MRNQLEMPLETGIKKKKNGFRKEFKKNSVLFLMLLPGLIVLFFNSYLPMGGLIMAFQRINFARFAFFGDWVGLDNLKVFFESPFAFTITFNTLFYNFMFIIFGTLAGLFFAIALNEITRKYAAKFYQTVMFLPYFMSWIVISYIVAAMMNTDYGFINSSILKLFHLEAINWYATPQFWPIIIIMLDIWKGAGYGSVMYLASITNLDNTYYEAAVIDGATKWQQIWKITLPLLKPMIVILSLLSVGRIFNTDIGLFYAVPMLQTNGALTTVASTIDTYIYVNLNSIGNVSAINIGAAASFLQSILGFVLVVTTNFIVKKIDSDDALF